MEVELAQQGWRKQRTAETAVLSGLILLVLMSLGIEVRIVDGSALVHGNGCCYATILSCFGSIEKALQGVWLHC